MQQSICDRHVINSTAILVCQNWELRQVDSEERDCFNCNRKLAISKEVIETEKRLKLKPVCLTCAIRLAQVKPDMVWGGLVYKNTIVR